MHGAIAASGAGAVNARDLSRPDASDEVVAATRRRNAPMKLGMLLKYDGAPGGPNIDLVLEAERLGYDSVWAGESYGTDAVTPITWVLARTTRIKAGTGIMQMSARTPACAAMTAMTLSAMSNGRFLMGIGPSGPQVIEGWHGQAYGKPLQRTKEYATILRQVFARQDALAYEGAHYQIPYGGADKTGLGKPLKSILKADDRIPIYTAAIAPAGLRTAGEVADGVQPIWMNPDKATLITEHVLAGRKSAGRPATLDGFDIAPFVRVKMGPDLQACRDAIKPELALYIGGMGAREKNFYNDYTKRLGHPDAAAKIQDAFLGGRRNDAAAAVPDALVDEISLVGPPERIRDRLQAWKAAARNGSVGTMLVGARDRETLRVLAEAVA
jgi:F420-dependent oxidoreductase-like protein